MEATRHTVVVIGSGFGGQVAALNLRRRGIEDFVILERRDFMGGTWLQNSYPGAAVDVQSLLYSIAGEPYRWSQRFAERDELEKYTRMVIAKHRLEEKTITGADVTRVQWHEDHWLIETAERGSFEAQFVINATGPLSTAVVPDFPGRDSFAGAAFHTNAWDHSVSLAGKKVAVVGSGASAAQVIPTIQPEVEELHVFQRTPHWVAPRPDRRYRPIERRLFNVRPFYRLMRSAVYWQLETRMIGFKHSRFLLKRVAQDKAMRHLKRQVPDKATRAKLTPDFTIGCKRVILSNTLYPALTAPNATLHDKTDPIGHVDETGIVTASGEHLDLDVIVWSTGFDATDGIISFPVIGRDGVALTERWDPYPRAYLGTTIPGFPNFFVVTGPNTGIGHTSAIFVIETQMYYLMQAIEQVLARGKRSIEVTEGAEEDYTAMIHREMEPTVWKSGGCHSWYQSKSGHVTAMFPGFSFMFRRLTQRFRPEHHRFA